LNIPNECGGIATSELEADGWRLAMDELEREGRCLCGALRFRVHGEPRFISNCHCESCRRASSAPSVTWAGFREEQVCFEGATMVAYSSSPGVTRSFCGRCGSPIAFRGALWAGEVHLPVCAFEAPEHMTPASDHFEEEKLPWAALLGRA
jgi:hypothetical protein